ncbi:MAG: hypothetical protein HQM15_11470 [Deltaproteobacteria bacterium]|nr:hypothetical protein [Deltaproteobacteria bacterium]
MIWPRLFSEPLRLSPSFQIYNTTVASNIPTSNSRTFGIQTLQLSPSMPPSNLNLPASALQSLGRSLLTRPLDYRWMSPSPLPPPAIENPLTHLVQQVSQRIFSGLIEVHRLTINAGNASCRYAESRPIGQGPGPELFCTAANTRANLRIEIHPDLLTQAPVLSHFSFNFDPSLSARLGAITLLHPSSIEDFHSSNPRLERCASDADGFVCTNIPEAQAPGDYVSTSTLFSPRFSFEGDTFALDPLTTPLARANGQDLAPPLLESLGISSQILPRHLEDWINLLAPLWEQGLPRQAPNTYNPNPSPLVDFETAQVRGDFILRPGQISQEGFELTLNHHSRLSQNRLLLQGDPENILLQILQPQFSLRSLEETQAPFHLEIDQLRAQGLGIEIPLEDPRQGPRIVIHRAQVAAIDFETPERKTRFQSDGLQAEQIEILLPNIQQMQAQHFDRNWILAHTEVVFHHSEARHLQVRTQLENGGLGDRAQALTLEISGGRLPLLRFNPQNRTQGQGEAENGPSQILEIPGGESQNLRITLGSREHPDQEHFEIQEASFSGLLLERHGTRFNASLGQVSASQIDYEGLLGSDNVGSQLHFRGQAQLEDLSFHFERDLEGHRNASIDFALHGQIQQGTRLQLRPYLENLEVESGELNGIFRGNLHLEDTQPYQANLDWQGTLRLQLSRLQNFGHHLNIPGFYFRGSLEQVLLEGNIHLLFDGHTLDLSSASETDHPLHFAALLRDTQITQDPRVSDHTLQHLRYNESIQTDFRIQSAQLNIDRISHLRFMQETGSSSPLLETEVQGIQIRNIEGGGVFSIFAPVSGRYHRLLLALGSYQLPRLLPTPPTLRLFVPSLHSSREQCPDNFFSLQSFRTFRNTNGNEQSEIQGMEACFFSNPIDREGLLRPHFRLNIPALFIENGTSPHVWNRQEGMQIDLSGGDPLSEGWSSFRPNP